MDGKVSLFDRLGGYPTLRNVHKIFYDKIYADPWMGPFFAAIDQKHIENQQTDFMADAMGGPSVYCGAFPIPAHKHMNITDELFTYRHDLLAQSLQEAGVPQDLAAEWLRIDGAFRTGLVKKSLSECKRRFATDDIIDVPKPGSLRKAG